MGIEDRDADDGDDDDNGDDGEYSIALAYLTATCWPPGPAVGSAGNGKLSRLTFLMRPAVWATTTGP